MKRIFNLTYASRQHFHCESAYRYLIMSGAKEELHCADHLFTAAEKGNVVVLRELLKKASPVDINTANAKDKVILIS